jgi:hydrogenase maturation factor
MNEIRPRKIARPHLLRPLFTLRPENSYCMPDAHGYCSTCSDEATPARVAAVSADGLVAIVEMGSETSEIDISLVEGVAIGHFVMVHGGVALGLINNENPK